MPLLAACNRYDVFLMASSEQTSFSNKADVLFVIDNSPSMYDNTSSLGLSFNTFIEYLVDPEAGSGQVRDDLSDAVGNYIDYVTQVGRYLNYQLAITTTSVEPSSDTINPGEAGTLVGDPAVVSEDTTDDVASVFRKNLLCETTDWPAACTGDSTENCIPYDPNYTCGDDPGDQISWEYLECVCGSTWEPRQSGSGTEEGLEAAFLALCRASENPPEACFDSIAPFTEADVLSNEGFLREDSTVIVVVVSDEGDTSRRLPQGEEDPEEYLDLLESFDHAISFVGIGPNYIADTHEFPCNSGSATTWGTLRYQTAAAETGGFFNYIEAEDEITGSCGKTDFAKHLQDLGALLNTLLEVFFLQTVPDPSTIRVFVDDVEVSPSLCETDDDGDDVCESGWVYLTDVNAVKFYGDAVPDHNSMVRIYYQPLSEMPRTLPF